MAKRTKEELLNLVPTLGLSDELQVSLLEDITDSFESGISEEDQAKINSYDELNTKYLELLEKYKSRFLENVSEVVEEAEEKLEELEEKEVVNITEI